jgi:hypothetical protein
MCIQSITNSGLKQRVIEYYKREVIQVYGFEHMLTMNNLEKCGLLRVQVTEFLLKSAQNLIIIYFACSKALGHLRF